MAFNPGDTRASHTIRIFGTNKDGEVLHDIWLDIERIDVYFSHPTVVTSKNGSHKQGIFRQLHWLDDPESNDYAEEHPVRTEGTLKICSPDEEDQEDPEEWVPVKTIIEMDWKRTTHNDGMNPVRGNRTSADNESRLVEARRCFYRETIIDEDVDVAIENNPELKAYVVASDQYNFKTDDYNDPNDETKDEDNYIEVQYVSCTLDQSSPNAGSPKNQGIQTSFKNSHYLNFTKEAEGPFNEKHGFDPPWALDVFQAIVNVNWGGLAVEFGDKDENAPGDGKPGKNR